MKRLLIFSIAILLVLSVSQQVFAYAYLGGKHTSNSISYTPRDFNGTYDKVGKPFNDALADWNATATKINFFYNATTPKIVVKANDYGNVSWSGRCTNYRELIVGYNYSDSVIEGNLYYLNKSTYSASKVKGVWAHELGHALGLAHVSGSNKLMYDNDARTVYQPTYDEVDGINALYK